MIVIMKFGEVYITPDGDGWFTVSRSDGENIEISEEALEELFEVALLSLFD